MFQVNDIMTARCGGGPDTGEEAMPDKKPGVPKRPRFLDDMAFRCLRTGDIDGFHKAIEGRDEVDFSNCDLLGTDVRNADLSKVILRGAYLKDTDLRGQNLRHMDLEGCSMYRAKINGCFLPNNLSVEEVRLSLEFGSRLRTTRPSGQ